MPCALLGVAAAADVLGLAKLETNSDAKVVMRELAGSPHSSPPSAAPLEPP
jgi:hypothetical protein